MQGINMGKTVRARKKEKIGERRYMSPETTRPVGGKGKKFLLTGPRTGEMEKDHSEGT